MLKQTAARESGHAFSGDHDSLVCLARGDAGPFWRYFWCHRDDLLRLCMRWLGSSRDQAEDVLSTSALKLLDTLRARPVQVREFRSWLIRSLHNSCIDVLRAQYRTIDVAYTVGRVTESPARRLERRELGHALESAVARLPPRLREVFVLRCIEERSYREIAGQLAISQSNARKRVQHARQVLRQDLAMFR